MEIVVNDTNIFIDLHSIGLLESFFALPIKVHTVDFVINEITIKEQLDEVNKFVIQGNLNVQSFSPEELMEIFLLHSTANGNVSLTDCSVWHYALKNNYTLLTGDAQLRKKAIESNVTVKGIIYIFDLLVENQIITPQQAANKLSELKMINKRLPRKIIDERIEKWKV